MSYDNIPYWIERGKTYKGELESRRHGKAARMFDAQEKALPEIISLLKPDSVLEVGCGYGRMTGKVLWYNHIKQYDALDVSPVEIAQASGKYVHQANFFCSDFQSWEPYRKYDLVFACEVLLHIPAAYITGFMLKMSQLSNRWIINLDYYETKRTLKSLTLLRLNSGNFNHDYPEIYKSLGIPKVKRTQLESKRWYGTEKHPQSIFIAEKP